MNSILATEKGLPPGLWLPTPEESTQQYLAADFAHGRHEYEKVVDYGAFMVALLALRAAAPEGERISTMPTNRDVDELRAAGYGMSSRSLIHHYGGISRLQLTLGYYPDRYDPPQAEVIDRFKWIKDYAFERDEGHPLPADYTVEDLIQWGAARDYTPAFNRTRNIFDRDTTLLRRMLGLERRSTVSRSYYDLYMLGARIIAENDGPISEKEVAARYSEELPGSVTEAIAAAFKTFTRFWLEFGYLPTTSGLDTKELALFGAQWMIRNDGAQITTPVINELSAQQAFPSRFPIKRLFGSIPSYRDEATAIYHRYCHMRERLTAKGISLEVVKTASHAFSDDMHYITWLESNAETLQLLSQENPSSRYILGLIANGLDLEYPDIYDMQLEDARKAFNKLGIRSKKERQFILTLIPRLDPTEAFARLKTFRKPSEVAA